MTSEYRLKRRVQFYETDAAGIVHFSWYLRYMEEAEHALWREAGISIAPAGSEIGWPRVAISCEYHSALFFEDEIEILMRVATISRKTIRYECVITRGDDRIATAAMTIVCVIKKAGEPMRALPIPTDVIERLGVAVDA